MLTSAQKRTNAQGAPWLALSMTQARFRSLVAEARALWERQGGGDGHPAAEWPLEVLAASGVAHEVMGEMWAEIDRFFERHFDHTT